MEYDRFVDELYVRFGQSVRRYRRQRGFSQDHLAEICAMGRPTIAAIESGRQAVALHQALALSKALAVNLQELLAPPTVVGELEQLEDHDRLIVEQLQRVL